MAAAVFHVVPRVRILFHRLDLSRRRDGTRAMISFLWRNVARMIGARSRGRVWGESEGPRIEAVAEQPREVAPENLNLPLSDAPLVSVIIPTYGQLAFTLRCLASIQANPPGAPIEVIVVDDAYPGPDGQCLARVPGIRLIRREVNRGFLRTCNDTARVARGTYLLFLNNDTRVLPGWLDRMVDVFAAHPDAGIVGSKLLGEDATLREAGAILWKDGSAWNYGAGLDPEAPEFNYLREVDYCSGASILVRRQVFQDAGGFDEKYAPAYCEDADLAFRLRRIGLRTWYQPRSEVIHYEGASHGRDIRSGVKAHQVTNLAKFQDTWHAVLNRDHYLTGTHMARARDRAHDRDIVLIVDHCVPEPDRDAGSRTMMAFIRALLASGRVVKFWPFNLRRTPIYTEALQDLGVEVLYSPHQTALSAWLRVNGVDLDLVLLSRPDVAEICLPVVRAGTAARVAYYGHDLHFRRMLAQADVASDPVGRRAAGRMRGLETRIWDGADVVLYPSEEEAGIVRALAPSTDVRAVVPYALTAPEHEARPDGGDCWILFVAGFGHPPNIDGAIWFAREILPSIVAAVPEAKLAIVGSNPSASIHALCGPNVCLSANVPDAELLAWYGRAAVAVVPLRSGAGVKLKTVEALWRGVPLVLTPTGAQGLPGIDRLVPITSNPASFAASVCERLLDAGLRRRQSAAQIAYARQHFSEAELSRSLLRALNLGRPSAPAAPACVADAAMA